MTPDPRPATTGPAIWTPAPETLEPLLDLHRLMAGIRWRMRIWLSLALIGVLAGVAVALLLPSSATATTRLYLVHPAGGSGTGSEQMKTDVAILETSTIAEAAMKKIGSTETTIVFMSTYSGSSEAPNILDITVRGRDRADAVARAQALADAFIADHVARAQSASEALVTTLNQQRQDAQRKLDALNAPGARPGAAPQGPGDERLALQALIGDLERRAQDVGVGSPEVAAGTRIIDAPHAANRSLLVSLVINCGIGLIAGLGLGLVYAAVAAAAGDRPVLRRDIAAHLGASVVAQLPGGRGLASRILRRRPDERARVVAQLARLVRGAPRGISVLGVGATGPAAELAVDVGRVLAPEHAVVIVDDLAEGRLEKLAQPGAGEHVLTVVRGSELTELALVDSAASPAVRIGLAAIEPGTAWLDLPRLGPETLLMVRVGSVDAAWLHTVARQLADLDILVIGVVLVHPDPRDRTDGTLWDGLHHALRGRIDSGRAASLPSGTPDTAPTDDVPGVVTPGPEGSPATTNGAAPSGATLNGVAPDGAVPAGVVPDGVVPNGVVPNGVVPNGVVPNGVVPNGVVLDGVVPDGVVPDGAVPDAEDAVPEPVDSSDPAASDRVGDWFSVDDPTVAFHAIVPSGVDATTAAMPVVPGPAPDDEPTAAMPVVTLVKQDEPTEDTSEADPAPAVDDTPGDPAGSVDDGKPSPRRRGRLRRPSTRRRTESQERS